MPEADEDAVTEVLAEQNRKKIEDLASGKAVPGVVVPINERSFDSTRVIAYLEVVLTSNGQLQRAKRHSEMRIAEQLSELREQAAKAKMQAMVAPANGIQMPHG